MEWQRAVACFGGWFNHLLLKLNVVFDSHSSQAVKHRFSKLPIGILGKGEGNWHAHIQLSFWSEEVLTSLQIKWHLVCQYTRRGGGVTNLQIKRGKMCLHTEINFSVTLAQVECLQHLNTEQGFFVRWATRATHVWDGQLRLKTKVNFKI